MGSGASVCVLNELSSQQVADYIGTLPQLNNYKGLFLDNYIDGQTLSVLTEPKIESFLADLGIENTVHRIRLCGELVKMKTKFEKQAVSEEAVVKAVVTSDEPNKFTLPTQFFKFGTADDFIDGLTKKLNYLYRSVEEECHTNDGGKWKEHYDYIVYCPAQENVLDPKQPHRIRDQGHAGKTLDTFCNHDKAKRAKLIQAEVAVLRMYTGPFYVPWNNALRSFDDDPELLQLWGTCISLLYSAIFKLSYLSEPATVYRGVNESRAKLPDSFVQAQGATDFAGGVEMGFTSTSTDINVAVEYANRGDKNYRTVMEIPFDGATRAADVQWVSQYAYEAELIYPPCTYLHSESVRVMTTDDGSGVAGIRYIRMRATICTARPSVEGINTVTDVTPSMEQYKRKAEFAARATPLVSDERREEMEEFRDLGLPALEFRKKGFTASELRTVGGSWFSLSELVQGGYDMASLFEAGFSAAELVAVGWLIESDEDRRLVYDSGRYDIAELKALGLPGYTLRQFGEEVVELKRVGYLPREIYTLQEMVDKGTDMSTIVSMGYEIPHHHPGQYWNGEWLCCQNKDKKHIGCKTGEVKHHSWAGAYGSYWGCCNNSDQSAPGCKPGPHPRPFL